MFLKLTNSDTDGSEILRSPVELRSLSHYLQGFVLHPNRSFPRRMKTKAINAERKKNWKKRLNLGSAKH